MSFLGDIRDRRRENKRVLSEVRTKAKAEAKHTAKLVREAYKDEQKARRRRVKAEEKANVRVAKAESKRDKKALKKLDKLQKKQHKQDQKAVKAKRKHQTKMAEKALEHQKKAQFSPTKARGWAMATRTLVPVAAPLFYLGATWVQNRGQAHQAQRVGVSAEEAARFGGHGAALLARADAVRKSIERLRKSSVSNASGFANDAEDRVGVIEDAIRNADHMPPRQRERAHDAIRRELDGIDAEILAKLGIRP
ncbi:hypothetical protein KRX51_09260 [Corynebacterium sp. TAE3-ERU12]|uniref:DUF6474 family protein n=1 Tax=Corynebacterium sp. TAE3-ERU12 TaxID=2849491 RepID=UPI001C45AFAD|nr:DUF6474 family protein [Corynebacterium sp. TAE3-ERU12]MBV7296097.1 hypothetical protein [Corynebacterium sp. TAE3-ERU12]